MTEGRIPVSLQDERPAPGRSDELALPQDVRLDLVIRSEGRQRRVRDRELFVRGGGEREARVPFEDGTSRRQVHGNCG